MPPFGKGLAAKPALKKIGGGGMIRHRLLCLGYFDFGSVGLFNLGFLSLFAAYAQQSQNAAADVQSSQPTHVVAAVTGLRTLGGVVISWLIGVIITAACIVSIAAAVELVDDRILAALGAANGAFLVLDAVGLLGSGLVDHPLEAVCCRVGLVAALALMPVVGAVILPLCAVAVGMSAACCGDRCGFKNLLADGAFLMLSAVGGFGSCRVNDPLAGAVSLNIGLIAALALMPVIGVVILPLGAVAVGMAWRRILIGGLELHIIAGHGEGGSRLGDVCQSDIALQHDPLVKDLACLRCVRRNGHNGVLRDLVARCAVLVAGIAPLCTGRRSYIPQFKGTAMPEVAGLALYGAAASRAAVVALIGAVPAVARFGVIAFAAMARVCGCRVGRAVVVQRLQWTGMTGVCRWVDIRTGTDDMAAVCAGGVAGVALTVADLLLRIEHRCAAAVVTACIDRLKEETAAAGGTHGAELWDRAAPLEGGAVGHQLEQGLRLIGIPISSNRCDVILIVFAAILHLPADGFLTGSLLGIKPDLVAGLDDHTGCPTVFHRHKGGVLCPIAVNFFRLFVFADAAFSFHAAFTALGIRVFDHIPAAPAMGNHDELFAAGNLALFGVGIAGFKDELLHRLGRAADVEGIFIDTAEAGAVPVPAVIMDMALHWNDIVADGTSEHIDLAAAYCVKASVKLKGMREDALLGAGGHIMRFVFACFKQARKLVAVALRVAAHDTVMGNPMLIDPSDIVFRRSLAVFCEALISTPTLKSGNRPYSMNIK